jgi:hypothetical protein
MTVGVAWQWSVQCGQRQDNDAWGNDNGNLGQLGLQQIAVRGSTWLGPFSVVQRRKMAQATFFDLLAWQRWLCAWAKQRGVVGLRRWLGCFVWGFGSGASLLTTLTVTLEMNSNPEFRGGSGEAPAHKWEGESNDGCGEAPARHVAAQIRCLHSVQVVG